MTEETPKNETDESKARAEAIAESQKRISAWWVLGIVFGSSMLLGLVAHRSLTKSVISIQGSLGKIKKEGASLSAEQCASRVLRWVRQCDAMQSLCDASVHRLMGKCLEGRSRKAMCSTLDVKASKAHFTYARCRKRELHKSRRWKKICGGVYSTLWIHCMYWRKGKLKEKNAPSPRR